MPVKTNNLDTRINAIKSVLDAKDAKAVTAALRKTNGDVDQALDALKGALPAPTLQKVSLANSVAGITGDHPPLVKALVSAPKVGSLRDVALNFNKDQLAALIDPATVPADTPGSTPAEKAQALASSVYSGLYAQETSAVLQRMVQDGTVPIPEPKVQQGVAGFLANQPAFNIRQTSVYTAFQDADAFKGIDDSLRPNVVEQLKALQRVQAVSPVPDAVPHLIATGQTSALSISQRPESTFVAANGPALGDQVARQIHANAVNAQIRNENALMTLRETIRGSGLAMIDGNQTVEERLTTLQGVADKKSIPLNIENLFHDMDFCACEECLSVYSPAAYFVDLLQYLRNNDLDPANPNTGQKGIVGTPLEKLFARRPDLGCLELTCENTYTVLPYVDLANEVMESFIVHSEGDPAFLDHVKLDAFNVTDETTTELLSQPQHVNYEAYCILKNTVYPFSLPYHQPIDVARIWLNYMKTSRYELLTNFQTAHEDSTGSTLTPAQLAQLQTIHDEVLTRAADAEYLGLTQEQYIILTGEAFWPKSYFDLTLQQTTTDADYQMKIGVRQTHEYYGYSSEADMLSTDETAQIGLTFVKKQILPRTGIQYTDLVALLQTRFLNPAYPSGTALTIMDSIRFSYRFLQTLVDTSSQDPNVRYAKLIQFLNTSQPLVPELEALLHPDPCHQQGQCVDVSVSDFTKWVLCYFERIGQLVVLDSEEGPKLPISGDIYTEAQPPVLVGTLSTDGTIVNAGVTVGNVNFLGQVVGPDGKLLYDTLGPMFIKDANGKFIGFIDQYGIRGPREQRITWTPARDTCDLDKVRLVHLDGSFLSTDEYDRIQRFIRLWLQLGWTIDQTDLAITGSASAGAGGGVGGAGGGGGTSGGTQPGGPQFVGFDEFVDDCAQEDTGDGGCGCPDGGGDIQNCPDVPVVPDTILPDFLHQIVAIRHLLDLTGLPLEQQLTFWADIDTSGSNSLYSQLFLTHNLVHLDTVFESDANGNYLAGTEKISDHIPVIAAALKLKADDIATIVAFRALPDALTLPNVSALYRHSLLARLLHVRISDLAGVVALFGDPFTSAVAALQLFQDWGHMEDAGFTFAQLNYVILNQVDPTHPLAPTQSSILKLAKTLFDGLVAIDVDNPDAPSDPLTDSSSDLVRTKASLIYTPDVVEEIVGLLEGTTAYTTNAPTGLTIVVPASLTAKLKYASGATAVPPAGSIQVTGLLTAAESTLAKTLSGDPNWSKAIDRVAKQAQHFFNDVLSPIFPSTDDQTQFLLAGDIDVPFDPNNPSASDANTAPIKRAYFLKYFMPYLRSKLSHQFVVDTLAAAVGLANDVTDLLLTDVLVVGTPPDSALDAFEKVKDRPATAPPGWTGYLLPATSDLYTFVAISDNQPAPFVVNGVSMPFPYQQDDPSNVWTTDPVKLKAGILASFDTGGLDISLVQWKTPASPKIAIPSSSLLPDYSTQGTQEGYLKLFKVALLINDFTLSADEVAYLQTNGADFAGLDFNGVTLDQWRHLRAYASLRDSFPKTEVRLIDLFKWAGNPDDPTKLSEHICSVTLWNPDDVASLIRADHFYLDLPANFKNEANLVKLQASLAIATSVAAGIDHLFEWANPSSRFDDCHKVALGIQAALRSRYVQSDWEQVVEPLYDKLRQDQQAALVSYLLVQPELIDWGVTDADSLFEFLLIDVQMASCMQTSRIKQALSTVQLFVQRCMMGLEADNGVPNDALDRDRWTWMQKETLRTANVKVFLYPDNYLKMNLRDDKSDFFTAFEAELLQKDISAQNVEDALHNYLAKLDGVANLRIVGLFLDEGTDKNNTPYTRLHIFGRTKSAPFLFYYRYADLNSPTDLTAVTWQPWQSMQVDVPSFEVDDSNHTVIENGCYLVPAVWNSRLLVFFPQITKKTLPSDKIDQSKTFQDASNQKVSDAQPIQFWEIKMGWSEYRNGKWTQKQLSSTAVNDDPANYPDITGFDFVQRVGTDSVLIDIYRGSTRTGGFVFQGGQLSVSQDSISIASALNTDFHYSSSATQLHTLQAGATGDPPYANTTPYFYDVPNQSGYYGGTNPVVCDYPWSHEFLGVLSSQGLDGLYATIAGITGSQDQIDVFGQYFDQQGNTTYNELSMPYALYNWELGFYAPMELVDSLVASQSFDQALSMCQYVLNPYAKGTDLSHYWQFPPFKFMDASDVLESLFLNLAPNQSQAQINDWRNSPFAPFVVARGRPAAFMKYVVSKYIEILVAYGDYYFMQNSLETIPLAIQCYVLASHLYGPVGQTVPKRGKILPETYNSLLDKWDAFDNAMVELELAFPFSNQTPLPLGDSNGVIGLANIFGFATSLYFCIPQNPGLATLRATIDDRLFKIRNCEDINGVFRQLPLFDPPIDPNLLVQAVAEGISISSVLNDLNSPIPNYRFNYLMQKALEVCAELRALGAAYLSAKEKGDGEALSQLRAGHELAIQNLVMQVRTQQADEAQKSLDALQQTRLGPVYRMGHYLQLIGEDLSKIPGTDSDFSEIPDTIETPVDDSGLKLIGYEKEEMDKSSLARDLQIGIGIAQALAGVFHALPSMNVDGHPLGIGADVKWGFPNLANAIEAVAKGVQVLADQYSYESSTAAKKTGFLRQMQDRVLQANSAGFEIKNIDKQILTQQIRLAISNQEITNQQKQIDNAQEIQDFLTNKYTNQELYYWMDNQLRGLYYQAYTLAYDLANKAEKLFRFERGLSTSSFIQFGYWDPSKDGLLAGERLYIGLKSLEKAYQETRGHDFEVSKQISLRQLNPLALVALRETGQCDFELPEILFDMDWPGHFSRRIRSVSVRIPCVVGSYTSLNCTLRLTEHQVRISALAKDKSDYPQQTDQTDDRFMTVNVPISSIAVSSVEEESGVFDTGFGERYLPFEGAGVISKWRLELPSQFRQFDYDTITDVTIRIRYTSLDGGDKLSAAAAGAVSDFIAAKVDLSQQQGLFAAFDLKNDFSNEWYLANHPASGATSRTLTISNLNDKLPVFTKGRPVSKIQASDIYILVSSGITADKVTITQGGNDISFSPSAPVGTWQTFVANGVGVAMDSLVLNIADTTTAIDQMWVVEKYALM